jgi:hypothetical protein
VNGSRSEGIYGGYSSFAKVLSLGLSYNQKPVTDLQFLKLGSIVLYIPERFKVVVQQCCLSDFNVISM